MSEEADILRRELAEAHRLNEDVGRMTGDLVVRTLEAEAEASRLREALQAIASTDDGPLDTDPWEWIEALRRKADGALSNPS